jgi:hypothetical protein
MSDAFPAVLNCLQSRFLYFLVFRWHVYRDISAMWHFGPEWTRTMCPRGCPIDATSQNSVHDHPTLIILTMHALTRRSTSVLEFLYNIDRDDLLEGLSQRLPQFKVYIYTHIYIYHNTSQFEAMLAQVLVQTERRSSSLQLFCHGL